LTAITIGNSAQLPAVKWTKVHFPDDVTARADASQESEQPAPTPPPPHDLDQHRRSSSGAGEAVTAASEDRRQVGGRRAIDGEPERHQPLQARLGDGLVGVLDPVAALVLVDVVRLAVRQDQGSRWRPRGDGQEGALASAGWRAAA
jgi:hypothetical protein